MLESGLAIGLAREIAAAWKKETGREFECDCATDVNGYNLQFPVSLRCFPDQPFQDATHLAGLSLYANPDFRKIGLLLCPSTPV